MRVTCITMASRAPGKAHAIADYYAQAAFCGGRSATRCGSLPMATGSLCATEIAHLGEELNGGILVPLPLRRQIVFIEDCLGRAHWFACAAVDAFVRIDVQRALALVDAIHRAFVYTRLVFHVDAGLRDHVGHGSSLFLKVPTRLPAYTHKTKRGHVLGEHVRACAKRQ